MSFFKSFLISLGILFVAVVMDAVLGAGGILVVLMVVGTSVWAAVDAPRTEENPVSTFFLCLLLWIVFFSAPFVCASDGTGGRGTHGLG